MNSVLQACLSLCETNSTRCSLELQPGQKCLALIPMYFYNTTSRECQSFNYSGCDGNDNRFITIQECQATCGAEAKSVLDEVAPKIAMIAEKVVSEAKDIVQFIKQWANL